MATLPDSAAHATAFICCRTTPELCGAVLGCFVRSGGLAGKAVTKTKAHSQTRPGDLPKLVDEVPRPVRPTGGLAGDHAASLLRRQAQDERRVGYQRTSFPWGRFASLSDQRAQPDTGAAEVALPRQHRRGEAKESTPGRVEWGFLPARPGTNGPPDNQL